MKKKNYQFGASNYRKMNFETMWFHLEKGKNDRFMLFAGFPDEIKKCFDLKDFKEKTGTTSKLSGVCLFRYIGSPLVNSVEEFFEKADKTCRNIDDFFDVTVFTDDELFGNPIPENCRLASLDC